MGCGCPPLPGLSGPPGLAAPGCSLFVSPADTWGGSLTRAAFIRSHVKTHLVRFAKRCLLEPTHHAGQRRLPPFPSSSDQAASTLGFCHFSRFSLHLLRLIPECLSNTRAFLPPGQPFTLATGSFPSPPSPPHGRACPPPALPQHRQAPC